ncbi:LuxR C-terminal-related transcriptional regulator [Lentzea albidocapillata]|uniref:LuxR C-terminal-related transcriptional regulator n=1 Tax=Lentzea albidocapillata TaxID=40571 RepID=UPI0015A324AA|nr:LuxR family transcriptional regulator [Lentzea albidocapillata]
MESNWPLTGRTEELDLLEKILVGPDHCGVVVSGPAGVGKTRLATELTQRAAERGCVVERVTANRSLSDVAFGALIHLVPSGADTSDSTVELMQGLRDELRREQQVLLFVDDGHLLDDASAAAIHMLAATGTVFVVVTVRAREPVADPITTLWKDGLAVRLELQPLSRLETADVLAAGLAGQVSRLTVNRLWYATRGNVLFLRELARAGQMSGRLCLRGGVWSWDGDIAFGERLSELIEARLVGLTADETAVLEVLAVGEPLELEFLPHVDVLESLEARGLVSATDDGGRVSIRLAHPLYGESLRARMGMLRRRAILSGLADELAAAGVRRRGDLIRLAGWSLDGGRALDPETLLAAAREARHVFDHRATERFARSATEKGGGPDAHVLLADALYWQCRHDEAAAVLSRSHEGGHDAWRPIVTASNLFWGLGDTEAAETVLRKAQDDFGPSPEHDEFAAHRAFIVMFNGRPHEARAIAEAVLTSAAATDLSRARALQALIPALALTGHTNRAIEAADAGITFARSASADVPWSVNYLQAGQATAYWLAGRLADMHALAQEGYTAATNRRTDDVRGLWATLLGRALLSRGLVASARHQFREAADLLRQHDFGSMLSWCHAGQSIAATWLGDLDGALELLAEAQRVHQPMVHTHDSEILLAEAWLAAARGEHSRAERLVRSAADTAVARGQRALEALALHDGVRLGFPGLRQRLALLADQVDGELVRCFAAHAAAQAGTEFLAVSQRFEELGATLLAAETAASAARAFTNDINAKAAAVHRCRALARRVEGAVTPALRAVDESPVLAALTTREREIAELVARRLSNQEISDRLTLSIRTVENHLARLYGRLGVTRNDLPGLFGLD